MCGETVTGVTEGVNGKCLISQKFAYLTLTVNSRDLYQNEPSQDHTVHVHCRNRNGDQTARVHWLAARVGGRFTGRVEQSTL